jgi:chromosome segregation ATPase
MTPTNQKKIDKLNAQIEALKESIAHTYSNGERAKLDGEIKNCRAQIEAIKDSEREPLKMNIRIDDPTVLDRKENTKSRIGTGSIKGLGGGNFSVSL